MSPADARVGSVGQDRRTGEAILRFRDTHEGGGWWPCASGHGSFGRSRFSQTVTTRGEASVSEAPIAGNCRRTARAKRPELASGINLGCLSGRRRRVRRS